MPNILLGLRGRARNFCSADVYFITSLWLVIRVNKVGLASFLILTLMSRKDWVAYSWPFWLCPFLIIETLNEIEKISLNPGKNGLRYSFHAFYPVSYYGAPQIFKRWEFPVGYWGVHHWVSVAQVYVYNVKRQI